MTTNRCPPWRAGWIMGILASLCMTLIPWPGHGAQGHVAEAQRDITVHQGRLSVHLKEAEVRDVLTAIAQQAGITIHADLRAGIRVSMHFSGMALDKGLRHLLRRASLSSTMVYTRGPAWAVMLTAVYVFEEAMGPAPNPQLTAEPPAQDDREEGGTSFAEALAQLSSTVPPVAEVGKSGGSANFRALLESTQQDASPPGGGEESALARLLREALEQR
jgi:hypothetical protein